MNEGISSLFYRLCERIMHLAYINFLWIFFSLIGLGIFGIFPATAAVYALVRQGMINGLTPTFKSFFKYVKKEFWRANLIGWILALVGYILYVDFKLITYLEEDFKTVMYFSLLAIALMFLFVCFYVFPIFVHYDLEIKNYFFTSLIIIFTHPLQSILIGVVSFLHVYIIYQFPAFIFFFGLSVWAFCVSHISHSAFSKVSA